MVEVERTNERCIFLIENQNLRYYIIIPLIKQVTVVLGLIEGVNDQKVKDIPILNDKVVVVPVLNDNVMNYLKSPQQSYSQANNYFSVLINNIYGLLQHNQKQVDQIVLFNGDAQFNNFGNYFVNIARGRVKLSDSDLFKKEVYNNLSNEVVSQNVLNTDIPVNINAYPGVDINEEVQNKGKVRTLQKNSHGEPGFVSYVLLGVVIAVMSLIFLYMLI